jgi:hypothetical protein
VGTVSATAVVVLLQAAATYIERERAVCMSSKQSCVRANGGHGHRVDAFKA